MQNQLPKYHPTKMDLVECQWKEMDARPPHPLNLLKTIVYSRLTTTFREKRRSCIREVKNFFFLLFSLEVMELWRRKSRFLVGSPSLSLKCTLFFQGTFCIQTKLKLSSKMFWRENSKYFKTSFLKEIGSVIIFVIKKSD